MTLKNILTEYLQDDTSILLADGFDDAFIGITNDNFEKPIAIYDREKCIQILMEDDMSYEDALEYFEYNVAGAYVGDQTPKYVTTIEHIKDITPESYKNNCESILEKDSKNETPVNTSDILYNNDASKEFENFACDIIDTQPRYDFGEFEGVNLLSIPNGDKKL